MKLIQIVFALVLSVGIAWADDVEIIQLNYRTAEHVIPILRPLVEPGGAISGMQNTLVIRASRANVQQLRRVAATLDRMPRRLLISVRQDAGSSFERREAQVSGTV